MKSIKKAINRYFNGIEKKRLIISVESHVVAEIDNLIHWPHPAMRNRSEFIRQAIAEKLIRDKAKDDLRTP